MMSASCGMRVLALFLLSQSCASTKCASVLCTKEGKHALLEDARFDDGIQLLQTRATKIKQKETTGSGNVPFINQSLFRPSIDDWKKMQTGLLLLRGHAENSNDHKTATNTKELRSMLATLKSLYDDSNRSITELNATELDSKEWFANQTVKHEVRLAEINARDKEHILSHDFHTNGTRSENMLFDYWGGVRDRQHKHYVSVLKVKHGLMERVKAMIDVYEGVLAGKASGSFAEKANAPVSSLDPEPSHSQLPDHYQPIAIIDFCDAALTHVSDVLGHSSEM